MKTTSLPAYLKISPEVQEALFQGRPVVALESTVISHGMPYPQNLQTALDLENIVREQGAAPATMAVMDGYLRVGLTPSELERLASQNQQTEKIGRRDIPQVIMQKKMGATTISATMAMAKMAGIPLMATGGLGGVHREVEKSWDISADLTELGQTSVAVVCSGVKSILDIEKTLEYLETFAVPVVGYRTQDFPAFFTRQSGHPVPYRVESPADLALYLKTKWDLGLTGGVVIANPVPEAESLDGSLLQETIQKALKEMEQKGIQGKAVTPFLLGKVQELTQGESLKTNIALIKNNVLLGAQVAKALSALPQVGRPT